MSVAKAYCEKHAGFYIASEYCIYCVPKYSSVSKSESKLVHFDTMWQALVERPNARFECTWPGWQGFYIKKNPEDTTKVDALTAAPYLGYPADYVIASYSITDPNLPDGPYYKEVV